MGIFLFGLEDTTDDFVKIQDAQGNVETVTGFVEACMKIGVEQGVQLLGVQGGKIYLPEVYLATYYSDIFYSYYENKNLVPSIEDMQNDLNIFLVDSVQDCVANFTAFENMGIKVQAKDIIAKTIITTHKIDVQLDYSLNINEESDLSSFRISLPIELGKIQSYAYQIIEKIVKDPDWIDLTYLSEFDLPVSVIPHSKNEILISITDTDTEIRGDDFLFLMAIKYKDNSAPVLNISSVFRIEKDEIFFYKAQATDPDGDTFIFEDNYAMFDILKNGEIKFTPRIIGEHDVTITVTDSHGNSNSKLVKFIIE